MKKNIPPSLVRPGHVDYALLSEIADEIIARGGGRENLHLKIPEMLRDCIDDVIQTPRTGRRAYDELEKTEKTYIGTRVEIMLRSLLNLPKGRLDTVIKDHDVDIKHTMGSAWMIPIEALNHLCILVAADEKQATCYLGIIVARPEYLTAKGNRDKKKNISASGFQHILWLLRNVPYPMNFWRNVSSETIERIFEGTSGNERVATLFEKLQATPITRDVIDAVANQKDFTRRIRADKSNAKGGTRDRLAVKGIVLLSGNKPAHRTMIQELQLPSCGESEWMSYKIKDNDELKLARAAGFDL